MSRRAQERRRTGINPWFVLVNSAEREGTHPEPLITCVALEGGLGKTVLINGVGDVQPLPDIHIHQGVIRAVSGARVSWIHHPVQKHKPAWMAHGIIRIYRTGRIGNRIWRAVGLPRTIIDEPR